MKNRKQGFTLVEIMIVVMIIGLLAAIALPGFQKARQSAQENACINNLRQIDSAVDQYAIEEGLLDDESAGDVAGLVTAGYIKKAPDCPVGGTDAYGTQTVGEDPECDDHDADKHDATI